MGSTDQPNLCSVCVNLWLTFLAAATLLLAACREGEPIPLSLSPAPATPSPGPVPDARRVPIESLLEPGDRVERVLYGRLLPGEGEQMVVHSSRDISARGGSASGGGCLDRQDHLRVFAFDPAFGDWRPAFDADLWPSAASPFIPDRADVPEPCRGAEELPTLALLDLDGDGLQDLVIALATFKDGEEGPLLLEILSFAPGVAEPLYEQATKRGGRVVVQPEQVVLEQPTFPSRSGPLWRGEEAPNGSLQEVIAWDEALAQPVVAARQNALFCVQGLLERVSPDAVFVVCGGDGPRLTGFRVTKETRVLPESVGGVDKLQPGREVSVRVEGAEPDEEDEVNPTAIEIVVLDQRQVTR